MPLVQNSRDLKTINLLKGDLKNFDVAFFKCNSGLGLGDIYGIYIDLNYLDKIKYGLKKLNAQNYKAMSIYDAIKRKQRQVIHSGEDLSQYAAEVEVSQGEYWADIVRRSQIFQLQRIHHFENINFYKKGSWNDFITYETTI